MQTDAEGSGMRLELFVAGMMATVTVLGAIVAWRASVAADGAGDADFAGLRAALNAEETRALNAVNAYEHYGAFTAYQRYDDLGDLLAEDAAFASEAEAEALEGRRAEAHDLAIANLTLFPTKFRNRDGTYALTRELGELWADAAREMDLSPEPQFAAADRLRGKSTRLLGAVSVMAVALVCFTLVEVAGGRMRYGVLALGSLFALAGLVAAIVIEFNS